MTGGGGEAAGAVIDDLEADDRTRHEVWSFLRVMREELGLFEAYRTHLQAALDMAEASSMTDPERIGWVLWHAHSGADLIGRTMPEEN